MSEEQQQVTLPFELPQQFAILGHLIQNPSFFAKTAKIIKPSWFRNVYCTKILSGMQDFFDTYKRIPTLKELEVLPVFRSEEQAIYAKLLETIRFSVAHAKEFGLDFLSKEIGKWWQAETYRNAVKKSAALYNAKKPDDAFQVMEKMVKDVKTTSFGEDQEVKFTDPLGDFNALFADYASACTTGSSVFDALLAPDYPLKEGETHPGALLLGDTSVVMAPTNVGKSTHLLTIARHNILRGKRVLWITHEMRPEDLKKKMWCAILDLDPRTLIDFVSTDEGKKKVGIIVEYLRRLLVFVPINKPGLTVEEVGAIIQQKQEESIAKYGKGFDLVVEDYPAKLSSMEARGGKYSRREKDEYVYNYLVQMALENKFHMLTAVQTNRQGAKINEGEENRLLNREDVAESFGVIMVGTNVWTINRSKSDERAGRLVLYIDKSRSSETGWAVVCRTNYSHSLTHSDNLGVAYYRGSATYSEKLDQYLDQYIGKKIPDSVFLR